MGLSLIDIFNEDIIHSEKLLTRNKHLGTVTREVSRV